MPTDITMAAAELLKPILQDIRDARRSLAESLQAAEGLVREAAGRAERAEIGLARLQEEQARVAASEKETLERLRQLERDLTGKGRLLADTLGQLERTKASWEMSKKVAADRKQQLDEMSAELDAKTAKFDQATSRLVAVEARLKTAERDRAELGAKTGELANASLRLVTMQAKLEAAEHDRDDAATQLSALRAAVETAIAQSTGILSGAIGIPSPFTVVDRLKAESDTKAAALRQAKAHASELEAERARLAEELQGRDAVARKYEQVKQNRAAEVQEARRQAVSSLIMQLSPRRIAALMRDEDVGPAAETTDQDGARLEGLLLDYLRRMEVTVRNKPDEVLSISEGELAEFELDEEYHPERRFQVIRPGFSMGDRVLIRAKVRYAEDEAHGS